MRHIITVTPRIAEALVFLSTFPHITPIGTPDPDIFIIGMTAGIVISKVARSLALGTSGPNEQPGGALSALKRHRTRVGSMDQLASMSAPHANRPRASAAITARKGGNN
jgi:hypothetical protein